MSSIAIGAQRIAAVVGYLLAKKNFSTSSPNLPQRIAVFCELNDANQATANITDEWESPNAQAAGARYGYGSPAHIAARILQPNSGGGLDGIPLVFYPQLAANSATAKVIEVAPSGVATANVTHTLIIAGRDNVDGVFYDININVGDTTAQITAKITDAVNNVLGAPVIAADDDYVNTLTTKWKGLTADQVTIEVDTKNKPAGITYTITDIAAGSGTPSVQAALDMFGNKWNTIVLNGYGLNSNVMQTLEAFNGVPDNTAPTGRFAGIIMKPFIALSGTTLNDPSSITDPRADEVTISASPAPLSTGLDIEAAANDVLLFAVCAQNTPEIDILNKKYPDMPTPKNIGDMADYNNRDIIVKKGCSTVDLVSGNYIAKDPVTTYHPTGETPPQFRYRRDIMIDLNIRYGYFLLEEQYVVGKVIANDNDMVSSQNVIKPKQWKQVLKAYFEDLVKRGLIVDAAFSVASLSVTISTVNPNRFETSFDCKRTGVARQSATTANMGFNFGNLN
jgi:phage tail sheath gpL-like